MAQYILYIITTRIPTVFDDEVMQDVYHQQFGAGLGPACPAFEQGHVHIEKGSGGDPKILSTEPQEHGRNML